MKTRFRVTGIAAGIFLATLLIHPQAKADSFQFSFTRDAVGCATYGTPQQCADPATGGGIFTTGSLTFAPGYPGGGAYPIMSMTGQLDGNAMTPVMNVAEGIIQSQSLCLVPFFPDPFMSGGLEWSLQRSSIGPVGHQDFLYSYATNSFEFITISIVPISTPEPSSLLLFASGLVALAILAAFKR